MTTNKKPKQGESPVPGRVTTFRLMMVSQFYERQVKKVRVDVKTGKSYNVHNIPMNKTYLVVLPEKAEFCIIAEHFGHEDDVWYNQTFCGDRYAVFKRTVSNKTWYQITPWYNRFGWAQRKMFEAYNKMYYESEVK